jgi:AbrB family looped-hinge helix DNA binding protein
MRVTTKGQVTIPLHIREKLGIGPTTEIDFVEEGDRVFLVKREGTKAANQKFAKLRGVATVKMTTDEIMALTRADE